MDIRYSANQRDFKRYTTEETRKEFLIENLYRTDEVVAVYSHVDRMVTLGIMPVNEIVPINKGIDVRAGFGTSYFLERREVGFFNIGDAGKITVDGKVYNQVTKTVFTLPEEQRKYFSKAIINRGLLNFTVFQHLLIAAMKLE